MIPGGERARKRARSASTSFIVRDYAGRGVGKGFREGFSRHYAEGKREKKLGWIKNNNKRSNTG